MNLFKQFPHALEAFTEVYIDRVISLFEAFRKIKTSVFVVKEQNERE